MADDLVLDDVSSMLARASKYQHRAAVRSKQERWHRVRGRTVSKGSKLSYEMARRLLFRAIDAGSANG